MVRLEGKGLREVVEHETQFGYRHTSLCYTARFTDTVLFYKLKVSPSTCKVIATHGRLRWWLALFSNKIFLNDSMYIFLDIMLLQT